MVTNLHLATGINTIMFISFLSSFDSQLQCLWVNFGPSAPTQEYIQIEKKLHLDNTNTFTNISKSYFPDHSKGFGGKFGVQTDRKDASAVGYDHQEKLEKHESQKGELL